MLTCFLKSNAEEKVKCQISKFVDRIQLGKIGKVNLNTRVLRYLIVSVVEDSPVPLQELHMLIPRQGIKSFIDTSYTFLERDLKVNQASMQGIQVIDMDQRLISYDGITPIKVFKAVSFSPIQKIGNEYSLVKVYFNEPLNSGKHGAIRMHFEVDNFSSTRSKYEHEVNMVYFNPVKKDDVISGFYKENLEIRCLPYYKVEKKLDQEIISGGFDIVLNIPLDFEAINTPLVEEAPFRITWDLDGNTTIERRSYIWRLRHFMKESLQDCGMGKDLRIYSLVQKSITYSETKKNFWITIILSAVISAIISFIVTYFFYRISSS